MRNENALSLSFDVSIFKKTFLKEAIANFFAIFTLGLFGSKNLKFYGVCVAQSCQKAFGAFSKCFIKDFLMAREIFKKS
jgi:hypothetical protein